MSDAPPIILRNPLRVISPLASAALCTIMFGPPLFLADWSNTRFSMQIGLGVSILTLCVAWMCYAAWKAPFEMRVDGEDFIIRRLMREQRYPAKSVCKWRFAQPDAPPTNQPMKTNGVLYVTFADRTRFRAEITAEESARLVALLPPS